MQCLDALVVKLVRQGPAQTYLRGATQALWIVDSAVPTLMAIFRGLSPVNLSLKISRIIRSHAVYYKVTSAIHIIRVLHVRMDADEHL
jgi:hypothetical protein